MKIAFLVAVVIIVVGTVIIICLLSRCFVFIFVSCARQSFEKKKQLLLLRKLLSTVSLLHSFPTSPGHIGIFWIMATI